MKLGLGEDLADTHSSEIWHWRAPDDLLRRLSDFGVIKLWKKRHDIIDVWGTDVRLAPIMIFWPPVQILRDALHDRVPW